MTDIATLAIKIDALEAKLAKRNLDDLTDAGGKTEKSMSSLAGTAGLLKGAIAALGIGALAHQMIEANRSFQSLQASLKVATGSADAASAAYGRLQKFAAETPFAVEQSVNAFLKLKNLGLDPSTEAMKSYGNTASSMGKNLTDMIEAVADATTGEFERLKEFGIKTSIEGQKVSFTFQGVTTTVGKSAAEIEKYLQNIGNVQFAGAMDEQMKTLNGQFANLGDSIDQAFIAFGQGGFSQALSEFVSSLSDAGAGAESFATKMGKLAGEVLHTGTVLMETVAPAIGLLAENIDTVMNVLVAGAAAWATYAAATAAAAGSMGIQLAIIASTASSLGVLATAQGIASVAATGLAGAFKALTAAMLTNPAVWLAAAIGGLVIAIKSVSDANAAAEDRFRANAAAARDLGLALSDAGKAALGASTETSSLGGSAAASEPKIWSFKNATDGLTQSLWEQAKAARAARVEMLQQQVLAARDRAREAYNQTDAGIASNERKARKSIAEGNILGSLPYSWEADKGKFKKVLSGGQTVRDGMRDLQDASRIAVQARKDLVEALNTPIGGGDLPKQMGTLAANTNQASAASDRHKSAMSAASEAVDKNLQGFTEMTAAIDEQIRSVKAANDTIGMYGKSLYQFSALQDLINDAEKRGIKLTNEQKEALAKKALALGELKAQGDVLRFMEDFRVNTEAATRAMTTERGEIGLTGAALYAYRYEQEAINKAIEAHVELSPEHLAAIHSAAKAYGDNAAALDEQKDATQRANDELRDMISLLQGIGGLGKVLGGALGFLTGNDGAIGGVFGSLLKTRTGEMRMVNGEQVAETIGDKMRDVLGEFGDDLTTAMKGAATGMLAANSIMGKQGKGGQIGSALGGIAGQLGGQALGKALGGVFTTIGGPLGAIAGGILGSVLGNVLGGMLKKTKWARADISGSTSDDIRNRSNSGKFEGAVNEAASSVIKGLNDIAEQLGGVAGEFGSIAIGIRDGSYRVNTTGKSLKKSGGAVDFGEDGAAAVAYAIQQAIKKGAIDGINQSVLNLLQASGDFEEQLSKAVQLQNIFAEIASAADPMGYELQQLAKKFVSINALLAEANATPEEVAQVAAYQAQQEAAIRQRYAEEAAAKRATQLEKEAELLLLQGKATQALAKQREAELSQMDASLVALQKQIYAETDLATRRGLQIQLLEAQGNAEAAKAAQRAEEMRATEDVNKALQQQIYLTQDLRDAYDRQTESIQGTIDEMKGLGDTLKEFRKSIYAADETTLSTTQAMVKLMTTGALAATGDKTALGDLSTVGRDYLDAAKASAGSMLDYQRAQALVANYTDKAIGYTDNAVSEGEQQLALMKSQAASLISIDESAQSFEDALNKLVAHNQATTAASTPAPTQNSQQGQNGSSNGNNDLRDGFDGLRRAFERMTRKWNEMAPEGPMQVEVVS